MFKTLLKKQLKELKYMYFKDKKTGKLLTGKKVFSIIGLLLLAFFGFGVAFYAVSELLVPSFHSAGLDWLFFTLVSVLAVFGATFLCMFAASSTIYNAKDNEFLMTLPINSFAIVSTRLVSLYIVFIYNICSMFVKLHN